MNELRAVTEAFARLRARGERAALATVVEVRGSAYRRPGARMLVGESGATVGTVSAGCLERDVAEHAARAMASGAARLVEYDLRGDADGVWGLGSGCNGAVTVLVEPLGPGSDGALALAFAADCLARRSRGVVATVVRSDRDDLSCGARMLFGEGLDASPCDEACCEHLQDDARAALAAGRPRLRSYEDWAGRVDVFFDVVVPLRELVVFGAEPDAHPVVALASSLGWRVTVVDTRAREVTRERFREADEVVLCRPETVAASLAVAAGAAAVLMTHDFAADEVLLGAVLHSPAGYVGVLGPRQRTDRLLDAVLSEGPPLEAWQVERLHAPVGLDIDAETPEEIALSIVAEIQASFSARVGGPLRDRAAPIHGGAPAEPAPVDLEEALAFASCVSRSSSV